jgi:hypothetical protein
MRLSAALGALLVLFAQGAEFVHEHPAQLGCGEEHSERATAVCPGAEACLRAAPAGFTASPADGSCVVCRWSRGPLISAPVSVSTAAPLPPEPAAAPVAAPKLNAPALPGFLTRAPPAIA